MRNETEHNLIGIKLDAIMVGNDTHEIAAVAHMMVHGKSNLPHYDIADLRRAIDRLKVTVNDIDQRMTAVEKDMPELIRPKHARPMEVA